MSNTKHKLHIRSGNQSFSLHIHNYQFPGNRENKYDANWLILEIVVQHELGEWTARSPCMLTWEFETLIAWFEQLDQGIPESPYINFIEPELEFHYLDQAEPVLRVQLCYGLQPKWWHDRDEHFCLDFPRSVVDTAAICKALRQQLAAYPSIPNLS